MNSKERVRAVLTGQPVDRLPVEFHFADAEILEYFAGRYEMDSDDFLEYLENDIRYAYVMDELGCYMQDKHLLDYAIKNGFARQSQSHPQHVYDKWGVGWDSSATGQRPIYEPLSMWDDPERWTNLHEIKQPQAAAAGQFYDYERHEKDYQRHQYAVVILQYYGPLERCELLRGFNNFMCDMMEDKPHAEELLDMVADYRVELAELICQRDVAFGHGGDDYGTQSGPLLSLDLWRELIKPRLARIWAVYKEHGLPIVHHSCGNCEQFIDEMIDIGLDAIHPVQAETMDIDKLVKRYGDRVVYYGGFKTQSILTNGTPDDVKQNVKDTINTLGRSGRMFAAPINIMQNVPIKNFQALVESIHKYRYI